MGEGAPEGRMRGYEAEARNAILVAHWPGQRFRLSLTRQHRNPSSVALRAPPSPTGRRGRPQHLIFSTHALSRMRGSRVRMVHPLGAPMSTPTHPSASDQSFRSVLQALQAAGELHRVERAVDPRFELGAVLSLRQRGQAQFFANVTGYDMPVVGNVMNSRSRIALLLGIEQPVHEAVLAALAAPIAPVLVESAPVQQVVHNAAV